MVSTRWLRRRRVPKLPEHVIKDRQVVVAGGEHRPQGQVTLPPVRHIHGGQRAQRVRGLLGADGQIAGAQPAAKSNDVGGEISRQAHDLGSTRSATRLIVSWLHGAGSRPISSTPRRR